jgi:thiamine phosphate synthase YjbQ (UPF0047 family)
MQTTFTVRTSGPGLYEFTEQVTGFVRARSSREGLLTLFVQHTSCSLCIQENADPDVRRDLDGLPTASARLRRPVNALGQAHDRGSG